MGASVRESAAGARCRGALYLNDSAAGAIAMNGRQKIHAMANRSAGIVEVLTPAGTGSSGHRQLITHMWLRVVAYTHVYGASFVEKRLQW